MLIIIFFFYCYYLFPKQFYNLGLKMVLRFHCIQPCFISKVGMNLQYDLVSLLSFQYDDNINILGYSQISHYLYTDYDLLKCLTFKNLCFCAYSINDQQSFYSNKTSSFSRKGFWGMTNLTDTKSLHSKNRKWPRSGCYLNSIQFSSVQLLSHIQLFATPWTAALQVSLSITNSQSEFTQSHVH